MCAKKNTKTTINHNKAKKKKKVFRYKSSTSKIVSTVIRFDVLLFLCATVSETRDQVTFACTGTRGQSMTSMRSAPDPTDQQTSRINSLIKSRPMMTS